MPPSRPLVPFDSRLVGVRYGVNIDDTRFAVSCLDTQRVCVCDTNGRVVGDSGSLGDLPGAIGIDSLAILSVVTEGGNILRFSHADTPIQATATSAHAEVATWLISDPSSTCILVPGRAGTIVAMASADIVGICDSNLSEIVFAVGKYSAPYHYTFCFDGIGNGAIVRLNTTTHRIEKLDDFTATNCIGPVGGFVTGTNLVVACAQRPSVCVFDISNPLAPTRSSQTLYPGFTVTGVINDGSNTPTTLEPRGTLFAETFQWNGGMVTTDGDIIYFAPRQGRLGYIGNLLPFVDTGPSVTI